MSRHELVADEMEVGIRKSDESPWIKFYFGEFFKGSVGELYKVSGNRRQYKIIIDVKTEAKEEE